MLACRAARGGGGATNCYRLYPARAGFSSIIAAVGALSAYHCDSVGSASTMLRRFVFLLGLALLLAAGWPARAQPERERAEIWHRLTPEQREQLWRGLTPEQKGELWRRLSPEQRQAIREQLTPEQRELIRRRWLEQRRRGFDEGQVRRLTPEERQRLREQIRDANRDWRTGGGRDR